MQERGREMSVLLSEIKVGQNQAYVENNEDTVIGDVGRNY